MSRRSGLSKRNLLDKASAAQSLDGNRLTGSLLSPRGRTIGDRSVRMQGGKEAKIASRLQRRVRNDTGETQP